MLLGKDALRQFTFDAGVFRTEGKVSRSVLRFLMGIWFLLAFIMGAGYGGNLKQFLINPGLSAPIGNHSRNKVLLELN